VISSAYDSQYGHPTEEVLERLADRSIPAYWTATHGNVVLVSGGEGVSVRTQRAAPTDPTAIRDAEPAEPRTTGPVSERARLGGFTATPTMTTVATDGGTADGELVVDEIHADAAGDERENLDDEYVVFANDGDAALDLTGWTVEDEAGATYTFPDGYTLDAGERVTLHTGSGTDTERDLYWGSGSPIWNNGGDTVIVRNSQGDVVREVSYP
jgi:competence protein ComEC